MKSSGKKCSVCLQGMILLSCVVEYLPDMLSVTGRWLSQVTVKFEKAF